MYAGLKAQLEFVRMMQITLMFALGLIIYLFSNLPHAWWVFLTVMIISAMVEPGLVVERAINRGKGSLAGIILAIFLIYLFQFNYRLIIIAFIIAGCLTNALSRRYDLAVVAITVMLFMMTAHNATTPNSEGLLEEGISRILCTAIGIGICVGGDYLLLKKFCYSRKRYAILQRELFAIMEQRTLQMMTTPSSQLNTTLMSEDLVDTLNNKFTEASTLIKSLRYDLHTDKHLKNATQHFEHAIWQMRKHIYAIFYCKFIRGDLEATQIHYEKYTTAMQETKESFISY